MTVREAAEFLRVSVPEIHRRFADGRLERYYNGTRLLCARAQVIASVIQRAEPPRRALGRRLGRRPQLAEPAVMAA
jgi:excisionase family DNA binding protein